VLTDVRMPGTSGLDLATQIGVEFPTTAVVMVSGVDDPETAGYAIERGVYGYVLKPFRATEIQITVMNALRRRSVEQENRRHREALEEIIQGRTAELRVTLQLLAQSNDRLRLAQEEIIKRLSIASEVRDEETGAHIHRMSAYSAVLADEFGLDADFFSEHDVHIHYPEGAIPKDGPSAGITMATSLVSALTRTPVRRDVAMTGEITLRGRVLPIGGLKEKVLAAHRAGMKLVILPDENKKDIRDIPQVVRSAIKLVTVKHMDEVIPLALTRDIVRASGAEDATVDPMSAILSGTVEDDKTKPAVH
jgi:FixJ family two-component response regulator